MPMARTTRIPLKRTAGWAGFAGPALPSSLWGRGNIPLGKLLCVSMRPKPLELAARSAQATNTLVGVAEEARDAATERSDRHNGDNGDQADKQGVLHHGGATLGPRTLEQVAVETTDREERVQKQLSHLNIPLSHPKELRTVARQPI